MIPKMLLYGQLLMDSKRRNNDMIKTNEILCDMNSKTHEKGTILLDLKWKKFNVSAKQITMNEEHKSCKHDYR